MSSLLRVTLLYLLTAIIAIAADSAPSDHFNTGLEAYQGADYAGAKTAFNAALEQTETAAARHNLGLTEVQLGKPAEAIWQLERAQRLAPFNADYRFKTEALRQQLELFAAAPKWYELPAAALPTTAWLLIATASGWLLVAAIILPRIKRSKAGLGLKSLRCICVIGLFLSLPASWVNLRQLDIGTVVTLENVSMHAAPASAAPESGTARPGERARILDQYNDFYEIETEGQVIGWISKNDFRPLAE